MEQTSLWAGVGPAEGKRLSGALFSQLRTLSLIMPAVEKVCKKLEKLKVRTIFKIRGSKETVGLGGFSWAQLPIVPAIEAAIERRRDFVRSKVQAQQRQGVLGLSE